MSPGSAIKNLSIKTGIRGHNLATKQSRGKDGTQGDPERLCSTCLAPTPGACACVCVCACARVCVHACALMCACVRVRVRACVRVCVCGRMHFFLHRKPDRLAHSGEMSELMALHFL